MMLSPQVWRAIGWRPVINTDYDGAVLVGGLENELRHFGDPDEEHDFWGDPPPIKPCPYTHEGARAIAAAKKKEKQQQLRAARASVLGISKYENNVSDVNCDEAVDGNEEEEEESQEDGYTIEADGDPLEFHDDWFGGDLPEEDDELEVKFEGCSICGGISKGKIAGDSEEIHNCAQNADEIVTATIKDSVARTYPEDDESDFDHGESFILMFNECFETKSDVNKTNDDSVTCRDQAQIEYESDLDLGESFILMFNEDFETKNDVEEFKNIISSIEPSQSHCFCEGDSTFVEINNTNTINGLNGVEKTPCPARAVITAQPGLWRAMTACRPFERAWRPHLVRPGSWQAV
ncbi:hypothetical protein OCU04_001249 [Sclerotinia nivalis]|uniref:Uncharacterized protein n=1 Tax=Sclerotinia nivalis TaxID=352851 RepID=A0A9X0DQI6_9HELO|nr:hypothetical protein OCU04_001249 [Sclerotinia nivalis]